MFNLNGGNWGNALYLFIIIGLMFSRIFMQSAYNRNEKLKNIAIWIMLIFFIAVCYNNKHLLNGFIPYKAINKNGNEIEITRANDGHFYLMVNINGKDIIFLVDTGATTTTLNIDDAKKLNIDTANLKYDTQVNTANGKTYNAKAEISNLIINDYKIDKIWVSVSKELEGNSLIGMNFLNNFKSYKIEENKMTFYY